MSVQRTQIFAPVVVGTGGTVLYTVPLRTSVTFANLSFTNYTALPVRLDVTITPSGGSALTVVYNETVAPSPGNPGGVNIPQSLIGLTLNAGDVITATAGTATSLVAVGSGLISQ